MAEGKNSFILYKDLIHVVKKLPKEKQAELFVLILDYVNDLNPIVDDMLLDIVFEPIKQQLKRDLKIWENIRTKRSESGKLGGVKSREARKQNEANEANALSLKQNEANEAVTVNVNDTVINNIDTNVSCQSTPDELEIWKSLSKDKMSVHNFIKTRPKITEPYFEYWNQFAESYGKPRLIALTDKRKKKLKTRIKEPLFELNKILAKVKESEFIMSETWFTFDWIIESEANYMKVLEGNYSRKQITA